MFMTRQKTSFSNTIITYIQNRKYSQLILAKLTIQALLFYTFLRFFFYTYQYKAHDNTKTSLF